MRTIGSHWRRAAPIGGIVGGVIVARTFGPAACLRLENLSRLTETIEGYGALGPALYIAAYVLGVVFFVPGLPMTLLGGRAFGPVRGAAYVWIAAITGLGPHDEGAVIVIGPTALREWVQHAHGPPWARDVSSASATSRSRGAPWGLPG
jgi:uncharacterized membrane protein YdjX (TVP38/TMEM64 family)